MHENRVELMRYRLNMAKEKLHAASILLECRSYKDSVSRSYYAMFTAVRAVLALDGVDKNMLELFLISKRNILKQEFLIKMYSKYLSQAFQIRNNTDYADFFIVSQLEAKEQYDKALDFCHTVETYLVKRISQ